MTTRRSCIKTSSVLSAGLMIAPSAFKPKSSLIGLQLYTVREAMGKDPKATLAKVAAIGYNSVEGATYTGRGTLPFAFWAAGKRIFSSILICFKRPMRN